MGKGQQCHALSLSNSGGDDWYPSELPSLSLNDVKVAEGNTGNSIATFTVTLNKISSQPVSVKYSTGSGTAQLDSDYQEGSGTLTFAPGQKVASIAVSITGDTTEEADETFFVDLSAAEGANLAKARGTGTILDDDALLVVTTTADIVANDGQTSLREAMNYANAHAGGDVIRFNIPILDAGYGDGVFTL